MKIALDIDDTIAATNLYWAELCIKKYGSRNGLKPIEILHEYKYVKYVPFWKNNDIVSSFFNNPILWLDIPIVEKSNSVIVHLKKQIFCYITTRPSYLRDVTKKWLKQNNFPDKEIYMPDSQIDQLEWKKNILLSLGRKIDCMIDDNIEYFEKLHEANYNGRLITLNNYEKKPEYIEHYVDWEILQKNL